jgi:hypothetical protein
VSDLFQEVQEEYRREQLAQAWTKYRVPIIAAAVILVLAVAGYQGWILWHERMLTASSREFEAANQLMEEQQSAAKAIPAFAKLGKEGWGGYSLAAQFQEAAARATSGDTKGAVAVYDRIAASGEGGELLGDYARVRAAILLVDSAPFDDIKKRLNGIASQPSPWRIEAEELLAYANWRAGNKTEALRLLESIKANPAATGGVKQRATQMSAMIAGGLTVADLKKPAAAAPAVVPPAFGLPASPADAPTFTMPPAPTTPPSPTP